MSGVSNTPSTFNSVGEGMLLAHGIIIPIEEGEIHGAEARDRSLGNSMEGVEPLVGLRGNPSVGDVISLDMSGRNVEQCWMSL